MVLGGCKSGGRGIPGSGNKIARFPRTRSLPCSPAAPLSLLSPAGSWLRGEGQGPRAAEDQQGRGSLSRERLQRQIPGPGQESPSPAAPRQEAQRADQPENEQKERQGEVKDVTTSFVTLTSQVRLRKPKMLLKLWAVLSPRGKRVVDGLGGRQLGASVPE